MTVVLVVYDIATSTQGGERRLRRVASVCRRWGNAVQNSVYECLLSAERFRMMREELADVIDPNVDSIRFYQLGKHYNSRIG